MPSPTCTVNGESTLNGVDVLPDATITIALADTTDVTSWSLTCFATDDLQDAASITSLLVIDSVAKTAILQMPRTARGCALLFKSIVNRNHDVTGVYHSEYTTTFGVFAVPENKLRCLALNQTTEGDSVNGWIKDLNEILTNETILYYDGDADITQTSVVTCSSIETTDSEAINTFAGGFKLNFRQFQQSTSGSSDDRLFTFDESATDPDRLEVYDGYDTAVVTSCSNTIYYLPEPELGRVLVISRVPNTAGTYTKIAPYPGTKIGNYDNPSTSDMYSFSSYSKGAGCTLVSDGVNWFFTHRMPIGT